MKTIAYSEVPQTHSYVHLAYTSASTTAQAGLPAAFLLTVAYLLVYLLGHTARLDVKYPKPWRLMRLAFITVTGFLVLFSLLFGFTMAGG